MGFLRNFAASRFLKNIEMNYSLCSSESLKYSSLKFNLNIPISSNRVRYKITHFSTYANFVLTEPDDEISFILSSAPGQIISIKLGASGNYGDRPKRLIDILNKLVKDQSIDGVEFKLNSLGTIDFI
jgi:hypothetical protein